MSIISKRLFSEVAANSTDSHTYTVPAGKRLLIKTLHGQASATPDTVVYIIVDDGGANEDILFTTHTSGLETLATYLEIDENLEVKIVLVNDQGTSDYLGGSWTGRLV